MVKSICVKISLKTKQIILVFVQIMCRILQFNCTPLFTVDFDYVVYTN